MSSSLAVPKSPGELTLDEVTWLQGAFLSSLLCGVQITLSIMSFLAVLRQRIHRRLRIVLLVYISLLCTIVTAGQQSSLVYIQTGFIQSRNYPGGPSAFLRHRYTTTIDLVATTLFMLSSWMTESLLVWRCKIVCTTGDRPAWFGFIFPSVLLAAEFITGSLFLYHLYDLVHAHGVLKFALTYSALSLLLNVTVAGVIAGRLLLHRRRMVRVFGPGHGSGYAFTTTILIESASLYGGFVALLITCFIMETRATNVLQQMGAQVQSITSLLIIYRIAQGKGWKDCVDVSSVEWRGGSELRVEPAAVDLEMGGPLRTSVHGLPVSTKEHETPASASASCVNTTLTPNDTA